MELHRCRFVKFQPGAIHLIAAFSTGSHGPLVAVARADQRVELWQPVLGGGARANCSDFHGLNRRESNWICRQSLFSPTGPVEALCFACPPTLCTDSDSDSDDDALDDGASAVVGGSNSVGTSKLASSRRSRAVVPRLFTATADGSVNEFCLKSMQLVGPRQDSMGGGGVWCMAVSPCHRFLALGCEDGCIRLFDIDGPPGTMEYIKTFDRQKGRIVSLLWVPPRSSLDSNQDAVDDNDQYLLTGGGDGLIRKWSVSAGRAIQRITVGRGNDSEETLIWDLKYLGNNEFVSADSTGHVSFWDFRTCTLLQSFQALSSDVLSLAVDENKRDTVFAAGIGTKIIQFRRVKAVSSVDGMLTESWVQIQNRKYHTHDIRTLCWVHLTPTTIQPASSKKRSPDGNVKCMNTVPLADDGGALPDFLFSGGVDSLLTILTEPMSRFSKAHRQPIRLSSFPLHGVSAINTHHRLVVGAIGNEVHVYRLGKVEIGDNVAITEGTLSTDGARFLAQIKLKGEAPVAHVYSHGDWLAAIDGNRKLHVYKFKLASRRDTPIHVSNFSTFLPALGPCFAVNFMDSHRMAVTTENELFVLDQKPVDGTFPIVDRVSFSSLLSADQPMASICTLESSRDGRYIVFGNVNNQFMVYDQQAPGSLSLLPRFDTGVHSHILVARIHPKDSMTPRNLIFIFMAMPSGSLNTIRIYDLDKQEFDSQLEEALHRGGKTDKYDVSKRKEKVFGATVVQERKVFFWSQRWVATFEIDALIETPDGSMDSEYQDIDVAGSPANAVDLKDDMMDTVLTAKPVLMKPYLPVKFSSQFENILSFAVVKPEDVTDPARPKRMECAVVERPWVDILDKMEAPIVEKRYGV